MIRQSLLFFAAVSLAGCSTSTSFDPLNANGDKQETAQLAAYAATARFPTTAASNSDLKIATFTHGNEIKIVNFSKQPITDASVWINGMYVNKVGNIPAMGTVTVNANRFYDSGGRVLNPESSPVARIEIVSGSNVVNTLGPAVEQ